MAMQTKTIKRKMKSISNIGKITKAMEMISVSKMRKSIEKRNRSLPFAEESLKLLKNIAFHKNLFHPYLEKGKGDKILLLIVASNKGLCGGYNVNVSKEVAKFKQEQAGKEIEVIAIGKQSQKIAVRNDLKLIASFDQFSEYYSAREVKSVLRLIFELFDKGEYEAVHIAYTEFFSSLRYEAKVKTFIPLHIEKEEKEASKDFSPRYTFEPSEKDVLDGTVPAVLLTILYQYLLEALASEHSSRVSAMKNASDNAAEMEESLRINYNRARQAAITQEIAEIVGGSSAISSS